MEYTGSFSILIFVSCIIYYFIFEGLSILLNTLGCFLEIIRLRNYELLLKIYI
jgi:hypothetical protein